MMQRCRAFQVRRRTVHVPSKTLDTHKNINYQRAIINRQPVLWVGLCKYFIQSNSVVCVPAFMLSPCAIKHSSDLGGPLGGLIMREAFRELIIYSSPHVIFLCSWERDLNNKDFNPGEVK